MVEWCIDAHFFSRRVIILSGPVSQELCPPPSASRREACTKTKSFVSKCVCVLLCVRNVFLSHEACCLLLFLPNASDSGAETIYTNYEVVKLLLAG